MRYIWYTVHVDITHTYNTFMTGEFWKNILFKGETIWFHRIRATDGQFGKKHSPQKIPDSADFGTTHNLGHNIFKKPTTKSFLKTPPPKKPAFWCFFWLLERKRRLPFEFLRVFIFPSKKNPPSCPGPRTAPGGCQLGWSLDKMHYCCDTQHRGDADFDFFSLFGGIDFWRGSFHWCITMGMT